MIENIVGAIVTFLSGKRLSPPSLPDDDIGRWFFLNSIYAHHPQL
jgi:hypothetical protein